MAPHVELQGWGHPCMREVREEIEALGDESVSDFRKALYARIRQTLIARLTSAMLLDLAGDIETPLAEAPFENMVGEAYWRQVGGWEIWFEVMAAGRGSTAAQLRPATPGAREGFLEVHLCGAMRSPPWWSPSGRYSAEQLEAASIEDAG